MSEPQKLTLAFLALLMTGGVAHAAPQGRLAYLRGQVPWLESHVGAAPRPLPHQGDVYQLAVSATTGDVAYLEALGGRHGPELPAMRGVRLKAPYTTPRLLGAAWNGVRPDWLRWSDDGQTLRSANWNGRPLVWTRPGARAAPWPSASTSRDGRVVARSTASGVSYALGSAEARVAFTPGRPATLLAAVRRLRAAEGNAALRSYDPVLARDARNWAWSVPAVSPDGQAVYFAANLGQGDADLHNNFDFLLFRLAPRDGGLLALGKVGTQYGARPELRVSPDGRRLLLVQTLFVSAARQPVTVTAVDLATQTTRDLTSTDVKGGDLNTLQGYCWLADGRHVAYSVAYFRGEDLVGDRPDEEPRQSTLYVKDTLSGRTVRTIPGATQPGCGPR
ncbi:TolB family protein [Deinococcus hohokamensis]|uniref:TolB family protein n=1 Tax=Deinococcus hohokamensis TaxID=309883 RepID=A0ABV9ID00_9DEIO